MSACHFDWLIDGASTLLPAVAVAQLTRRVLRARFRAVPASASGLREGPAIVSGRVDGDAPRGRDLHPEARRQDLPRPLVHGLARGGRHAPGQARELSSSARRRLVVAGGARVGGHARHARRHRARRGPEASKGRARRERLRLGRPVARRRAERERGVPRRPRVGLRAATRRARRDAHQARRPGARRPSEAVEGPRVDRRPRGDRWGTREACSFGTRSRSATAGSW